MEINSLRLTIAIPTYNRPKQLLNTINMLLPQLNDEVSVLVLDNHSDILLSDFLKENLSDKDMRKLDVRRNFVNIGPDGNFMRCFEYCLTPYLWILADDDDIEQQAIAGILAELDKVKGQNFAAINFGSNYTRRSESILVNNFDSFLDAIDNFENLLLLSTSVYDTEKCVKYIRFGYWGAYSMASQIIPSLVALGHGEGYVISKHKVIINQNNERADKWPDAQQALAVSSLLEAPFSLSRKQYQRFGKFLFRNIETFPRVACDILLAVNYDVSKIDSYHLYIYKKIYKLSIQFRRKRLQQTIAYYLFLMLLKFKFLLRIMIAVNEKVVKKWVSTSSAYVIFKR